MQNCPASHSLITVQCSAEGSGLKQGHTCVRYLHADLRLAFQRILSYLRKLYQCD